LSILKSDYALSNFSDPPIVWMLIFAGWIVSKYFPPFLRLPLYSWFFLFLCRKLSVICNLFVHVCFSCCTSTIYYCIHCKILGYFLFFNVFISIWQLYRRCHCDISIYGYNVSWFGSSSPLFSSSSFLFLNDFDRFQYSMLINLKKIQWPFTPSFAFFIYSPPSFHWYPYLNMT
jgi:hypothetical protein